MVISLTVIMIEATLDIAFGLPMMVVLMIAKLVGDLLNEVIWYLLFWLYLNWIHRERRHPRYIRHEDLEFFNIFMTMMSRMSTLSVG